MGYRLLPGMLPKGKLELPPSKSEVIRAALLLRLARSDPFGAAGKYFGQRLCDDICKAIDAAVTLDICPDAGESASLMRMLACIQAALFGSVRMRITPRLYERGLWEAEECFDMPLEYSEGLLTGSARRPLGGEYEIDCSRTSQFLSGLIMALPCTPRECVIKVKNGFVSRPYAEMTADMVKRFGGDIERTDEGWITRPSRYSEPGEIPIHGDESYAAVFHAMNLLGGQVEIMGSSPETLQPDKDFLKLAQLGSCDISDHPDLAPLLAAVACGRKGRTVIRGTSRLRTKETDRENGTVRLINDLGGSAEAGGDCIIINGTGRIGGGIWAGEGDHRLCFAAAVLSLISDGPVTVLDTDCVEKSAPGFWNDYKKLLAGGIE